MSIEEAQRCTSEAREIENACVIIDKMISANQAECSRLDLELSSRVQNTEHVLKTQIAEAESQRATTIALAVSQRQTSRSEADARLAAAVTRADSEKAATIAEADASVASAKSNEIKAGEKVPEKSKQAAAAGALGLICFWINRSLAMQDTSHDGCCLVTMFYSLLSVIGFIALCVYVPSAIAFVAIIAYLVLCAVRVSKLRERCVSATETKDRAINQASSQHVEDTDRAKDLATQAIEAAEDIATMRISEATELATRTIEAAKVTAANAISSHKQKISEQRSTVVRLHDHALAQSRSATFERVCRLREAIVKLNATLVCGPLDGDEWNEWTPSTEIADCLRMGLVAPKMPYFDRYFSQEPSLVIPLLVDYRSGRGVVIGADGSLDESRSAAQNAILRLLATVPPAGVKFVFIDPVSLGGNVAGFMNLEKHEPSLIGGKAWSDQRHIEQALSEITEHMETVIQKYLREDYKAIADYNLSARVKESYRILVVFDFPVNFNEASTKKLASIMRNGPRCGVFPIVITDREKPLPYGFNMADLEQHALVLRATKRS